MNISFEKLSSRPALGDGGGRDAQAGSRGAHDTQRANQILPFRTSNKLTAKKPSVAQVQNSSAVTPSSSRCGRPNSGGESRQFFIDERELLAGLLFFLVPIAAALIVLVSALLYAAFVL